MRWSRRGASRPRPRRRRHIQKKPSSTEIAACKPWLEAELAIVQPERIVSLGIGPKHRLLQQRGQFLPHPAAKAVTATVHPSAILRAPDEEHRRRAYEAFVKDLIGVRERFGRKTKTA